MSCGNVGNKLLISGSTVRARVRPPSKSMTYATTSQSFLISCQHYGMAADEIERFRRNVENIYGRVLRNYCSVAADDFGIEPPYQIELGALGLSGAVLGINRYGMSGSIHQDQFKLRRIMNDVTAGTQKKLIGDFLDALFDLAGEDRQEHPRPT
jgi:hypothetical protein